MTPSDAKLYQATGESILRRVDQACDAFEAAWQDGRRPRIEEYLREAPEPERAVFLKELLRVEFEYLTKQGDTLVREAYLLRFPEHAAVLDAALDELTRSGFVLAAAPAGQ